jgi:hypothetical protein
MAKARKKPTPVIYSWLRENILSLLREICGSRQQGERWFAELIAAKRVRTQLMEPVPPDEDLKNFWQGEPPKFDYEESTATKLVAYSTPGAMGLVSVTVVFQIVPEDIKNAAIEDGLITPPSDEDTDTASVVAAAARQMKKDGTIPAKITSFAKAIMNAIDERRKADPSIKHVGWPHIKNQLPGWGLWPASKIKV